MPLVAILTPLRAGGGRDDLVAPSGKGRAWGEYGLLQAVRRAARKAGVDDEPTFHAMRHGFVSALFGAGASARAVQLLAGHSALATTQRYAHCTDDALRATVDLIGRGNIRATAERNHEKGPGQPAPTAP